MFNALKHTQELEKAGFSKEQAEAAVNMVHGFAEMNLATKEDVKTVESSLRQDMAELRHEMRQEIQSVRHSIETLEYKMTVKLGGMLVIAVGAMAALQKIF